MKMNLKSLFKKTKPTTMPGDKNPFSAGLAWIKNHQAPKGGIVVHHKTRVATPEVTGYIIPTLYEAGEKDLAFKLARWEASIQQPSGSFGAPGIAVPYTFDTAQVIRGFLAVLDDLSELRKNLILACDYVESQITEEGKVLSPSYDAWRLWDGNMVTDYTNLYVLPPLLQAGQKLNDKRYVDAAVRGLNYFRRKKDIVEFKDSPITFSHIFGYMMEALIELGEIDLAEEGLTQVLKVQREDGAIPAYRGVDWVCSTGMAQLAIALYKLGYRERADMAMIYLEKIQNKSGGFYGSYGEGAKYFAGEEISWAVKFFLDAYVLRKRARISSVQSEHI